MTQDAVGGAPPDAHFTATPKPAPGGFWLLTCALCELLSVVRLSPDFLLIFPFFPQKHDIIIPENTIVVVFTYHITELLL